MPLNHTYPTRPFTSTSLTLDTLANAATFFAGRWHPDLKRNQSRDLLRLIYKLFAPPGGSNSQIQCEAE